MGTTAVLLITVMLFLWGVLSGRLERADLTAPIIFVAVGGLFAATGLVDAPSLAQPLKPLVELTLLVAAALAPTDAALGLPVVMNPAVASSVRGLITGEG